MAPAPNMAAMAADLAVVRRRSEENAEGIRAMRGDLRDYRQDTARAIDEAKKEQAVQNAALRQEIAHLEATFETVVYKGNGSPALVVRVAKIEQQMGDQPKLAMQSEPVSMKTLAIIVSSVSGTIGVLGAALIHGIFSLLAGGG